MTLVSTDKSKDTLKKYDELRSEIRYNIRSITNNLDDYDEKNKKTKFNSDDDLPLRKTLRRYSIIIVVRSAFR